MNTVFDLYGPKELAEMEATGAGTNHARPESLPLYDVPESRSHDSGFAECLAEFYTSRGFPGCAAKIRDINREVRS